MLTGHSQTNKPFVNALFSLMCFHASRFEARENKNGEMVLYDDQDESLWDQELIAKGAFHLHEASRGQTISKYHLEANIAYWHTIKTDSAEKWENILQLYNQLLILEYSPIAALNRTYALSKANGKEQAIKEAEKLNLINNHFYHTLLGELYTGIDNSKARSCFETALGIAKSATDKKIINKKISLLSGNKNSP
jgi:RNA polymerase sigma-70 factor (ECF subfamily)